MKKVNLLHNIFALISVQALSYVLPLITLPYVTRVLGVGAWGTVALVQIVLSYFTLVTNWGFSLSGTRKVAENRNHINKLSEIFIATWTAQWCLCIIACVVLIVMVNCIPYFESSSTYYLYGIGIIVGNILFPVWFLNGLEKMKELAGIQIFTRLISVPLTFVMIKSPSDAPLLLAISGFTGILSGGLSIYWIRKRLNLRWIAPTLNQIFSELKEGGTMFTSTLWISCYTTITPIILGSMSGANAVGYYAFADRFKSLALSFLAPISQSLFPRLSHLFLDNITEARSLLIKSSKVILSISFATSLLLWLLAPYIIIAMGGESFRPAIEVLRWLAPLPLVISLSNIFGIQVMIPNKKTKPFNLILATCGALSLIMLYPLIYIKGYVGASVNTLITEILVVILMSIYIWKSKILNKRNEMGNKNEI